MSKNSPTKQQNNFPYPPCWKDEERMKALLAPFREKSVNPENYSSKMIFWKDLISEYCIYKGKAHFCKQELASNFTRGQRTPACLDTVIEEMYRLKLIRLRTDYEYDPQNGWKGWAVNSFVKKPMSWGLNKIKTTLWAEDVSQLGLMEYIHLEVIRNYCKELMNVLLEPPYVGALLHYNKIQKDLCAELDITEECLRLCLLTLSTQNKIGLEYKQDNHNNQQIHLLKVPTLDGSSKPQITEADRALHNLEMTQANLSKQLEDLEVSIRENEDKAREYLKENKRQLAKTYLRKKHLLEKNHEKRSHALHNIESLMSQVEEAKQNGVIVDAYKYGSKALQDALNTSNLTYDNVDEIIADMRETMENSKEMQDTIANANLPEVLSASDEDELEKELKEIMGEAVENKTNKTPTSNNNDVLPIKVEITDAELLAMLEGLEVEQRSPVKGNVNDRTADI